MDKAFNEPLSDQQLLRLLTEPGRLALPPAAESGMDPLGLAEFRNPHDAVAEQIFFGFSYICSQIAQNNPDVRAQFASKSNPVEFPVVTLGNFHRFGVRWFDDHTGKSTYEFYRADQGNPAGGFFVIQNSDGSTILSRTLDGSPEDENYPEILSAAQRALLIYAQKTNIPMQALTNSAHYDHLDDPAVESLRKRIKIEQKLYCRLYRQAFGFVSRAGNTLYGIFTKEISPGVRKPAIGRIALAAILMPLPAYSEGIRPASVELAVDAGGAVARSLTPDKKPDLEALYDSEQRDIQGESFVTPTERPIVVVSAADGLGQRSVIDFSINGGALHGTSPRRVKLRADLQPKFCQRLPVAPEIQDNNLSLVTSNSHMAGRLTVESTGAAVFVCNKTDDFIDNEEMDLIFDSRPHV